MSSRAQLFVGRLPIDIRERDVEQVFEKYGRLLRCDVKYGKGMYGSSGRRGSGGRTGMAYAFVDYDDRRDAEDAVKYENGREIRGQSIVVEWARGPSYRNQGGSGYQRNSNYRRDNYGRSRQNSEECYRCRRTGHWARDCPESERERYYPRSRQRSRSRSRSRSHRRKRSMTHSRSRSQDSPRRSSSGYRQKSRSISRDNRVKPRSPSGSISPAKSMSRSRSRSLGKTRRKPEKSKSKLRAPSKSQSRSRTPTKSRSRSPSFGRKTSRSPPKSPENDDYDDKGNIASDNIRDRSISRSPQKSISRSPQKSISRSPSKEKNRSDDGSDRSISRSKSR